MSTPLSPLVPIPLVLDFSPMHFSCHNRKFPRETNCKQTKVLLDLNLLFILKCWHNVLRPTCLQKVKGHPKGTTPQEYTLHWCNRCSLQFPTTYYIYFVPFKHFSYFVNFIGGLIRVQKKKKCNTAKCAYYTSKGETKNLMYQVFNSECRGCNSFQP